MVVTIVPPLTEPNAAAFPIFNVPPFIVVVPS